MPQSGVQVLSTAHHSRGSTAGEGEKAYRNFRVCLWIQILPNWVRSCSRCAVSAALGEALWANLGGSLVHWMARCKPYLRATLSATGYGQKDPASLRREFESAFSTSRGRCHPLGETKDQANENQDGCSIDSPARAVPKGLALFGGEHPEWNANTRMKAMRHVYAWLSRNDREWLEKHRPRKKPAKKEEGLRSLLSSGCSLMPNLPKQSKLSRSVSKQRPIDRGVFRSVSLEEHYIKLIGCIINWINCP